jgi:predicted ribosomally synthesized peptide with SipW-like signal peptide
MKKKMLVAVATVILVAVLAAGGTYAYFTSSVTNSNNTFKAGTVAVDAVRDNGEPLPGPMFYTGVGSDTGSGGVFPTGLWYPGMGLPGDSNYPVLRTVNITNEGTFNCKLNGFSATLSGISDPGASADFAKYLNVTVANINGPLWSGTLANMLASGGVPSSPRVTAAPQPKIYAPGGVLDLAFTVSLSKDARNDLQGVTPIVNFYFYVGQTS